MRNYVTSLLDVVAQEKRSMTLPEAMNALQRGELERPAEGLPSILLMAPREYIEIR